MPDAGPFAALRVTRAMLGGLLAGIVTLSGAKRTIPASGPFAALRVTFGRAHRAPYREVRRS
jgi:hypothetical protein